MNSINILNLTQLYYGPKRVFFVDNNIEVQTNLPNLFMHFSHYFNYVYNISYNNTLNENRFKCHILYKNDFELINLIKLLEKDGKRKGSKKINSLDFSIIEINKKKIYIDSKTLIIFHEDNRTNELFIIGPYDFIFPFSRMYIKEHILYSKELANHWYLISSLAFKNKLNENILLLGKVNNKIKKNLLEYHLSGEICILSSRFTAIKKYDNTVMFKRLPELFTIERNKIENYEHRRNLKKSIFNTKRHYRFNLNPNNNYINKEKLNFISLSPLLDYKNPQSLSLKNKINILNNYIEFKGRKSHLINPQIDEKNLRDSISTLAKLNFYKLMD